MQLAHQMRAASPGTEVTGLRRRSPSRTEHGRPHYLDQSHEPEATPTKPSKAENESRSGSRRRPHPSPGGTLYVEPQVLTWGTRRTRMIRMTLLLICILGAFAALASTAQAAESDPALDSPEQQL